MGKAKEKIKTSIKVGNGDWHDMDTKEGQDGFGKDLKETIGHNGAGKQINDYVERIERLEKERADLADDINTVLRQADVSGFDKKIIKTIVKIRKDKAQFEKDLATVETYMHAMGDQLDFHFDQSSAMDDLAEAAE